MTLRLGGVPEHFNHVFALAEKHGLYQKHNVQVEFVVQACGTGQMIESLEHDEVDVIVALTEGLVRHILTQPTDVRLLGTYVNSPLCWALSTRPGKETGPPWTAKPLGTAGLVPLSTDGARSGPQRWHFGEDRTGRNFALRDSVLSGETDAFLWETFTTKPFHDSGALKRSGQVVALARLYVRGQAIGRDQENVSHGKHAGRGSRSRRVVPCAATRHAGRNRGRVWLGTGRRRRVVPCRGHCGAPPRIGGSLETVESTLVAANVMDRATTKTWEQCIEPRLAALTE